MTDADGAMLEPLGVALHAVDLGHIRPGMRIGVFGCGSVGVMDEKTVRASSRESGELRHTAIIVMQAAQDRQ